MGGLTTISAQKAFDTVWTNAFNRNSNSLISAAQRASSYEDFVKRSGLQEKKAAYLNAVNAAPTYLYYTGTDRKANPNGKWVNDHGWAGYENYSDGEVEYRKDLSSIAADYVTAATLLSNTSKLQEKYNNLRNEYGTVTENADAGAVSTGNVSNVGDSGNGSVSSSSNGGRRQGGDMIAGDTARSSDNRGNDTLLGYSGKDSLKEKDTLF